MQPGAVVETNRRPTPTERPPITHAPRMVALTFPPHHDPLAADRQFALHQAWHFVAGGDVIVIRGSIGHPGEIHGQRGGLAGIAVIAGRRIVVDGRRRGGPQRHLLKRITGHTADRVAIRIDRHAGSGQRGQVIGDRSHHGPVRTDHHGRPPGDAQVGVEPDAGVATHRTVLGHEVEVVRLVPQCLGVGGVKLLVGGVDDVALAVRHGFSLGASPRHRCRWPVGRGVARW